jgi:hypothetical protein
VEENINSCFEAPELIKFTTGSLENTFATKISFVSKPE